MIKDDNRGARVNPSQLLLAGLEDAAKVTLPAGLPSIGAPGLDCLDD